MKERLSETAELPENALYRRNGRFQVVFTMHTHVRENGDFPSPFGRCFSVSKKNEKV